MGVPWCLEMFVLFYAWRSIPILLALPISKDYGIMWTSFGPTIWQTFTRYHYKLQVHLLGKIQYFKYCWSEFAIRARAIAIAPWAPCPEADCNQGYPDTCKVTPQPKVKNCTWHIPYKGRHTLTESKKDTTHNAWCNLCPLLNSREELGIIFFSIL